MHMVTICPFKFSPNFRTIVLPLADFASLFLLAKDKGGEAVASAESGESGERGENGNSDDASDNGVRAEETRKADLGGISSYFNLDQSETRATNGAAH